MEGGRHRDAAGSLAVGAAVWLASASRVLAASPAPSRDVIGDPRGGQTPGFVGDPVLAVIIVLIVAVASIAITLAWVRATGGPADANGDG